MGTKNQLLNNWLFVLKCAKICYHTTMKKLELTFAAILVPLDYLALLLAGSLAYFLRSSR